MWTLTIFFAFIVSIHRFVKYLQRKQPLPPGPKKWPLIGCLLDMPRERQWETYHEWCKFYGNVFFVIQIVVLIYHTLPGSDIIHLDVAGSSIVVLDTVESAMELLDKRSLIYSDR